MNSDRPLPEAYRLRYGKPPRKPKKVRCYLVPVGGDSLEFMTVQATKKPDAQMVKALRDLHRAVGKMAKEPVRRKA